MGGFEGADDGNIASDYEEKGNKDDTCYQHRDWH